MAEPARLFEFEAVNRPGLSKGLIWTLAVACGISVANLYYAQPLLADIGRTFGATPEQLGLVSMLTQVGYAMGLLFFVPMGDMRDRRQLIVMTSCAVSLALVGVALARNIGWLGLASMSVGLTTVVPQIIVPFAADMAEPAERGKVVGTVMSGLLLGILLARTFSGFLGAWLGWRAMYWLAAVLMFSLAVALRLLLPTSTPKTTLTYSETMRSLWQLTKSQPMLWETSIMGGALFGAFSVFWTTLVFFLEQPPYHYGSHIVGLFGLVGVIGASVAPLAGRIADRTGPRQMAGLASALTLLAYLVFWQLGHQLWGLILGVILLDAGVQGGQISNQATIYSLLPNASNRLNTIYMVSYFIGGAVGSYLGASAWNHARWGGVSLIGLSASGLALLTWVIFRLIHRLSSRTKLATKPGN